MSSDLRIRFGRREERDALEAMQRRASLVWEDYREALLAHPEVIQLPLTQLEQRQVRVAEMADERVGFSVLLPHADGILELDGLFVEPTHWRLGIGRALIKDAVDAARAQDMRAIDVTANPRAEAFYVKVGFVGSGMAQTQFGSASRMRLVLVAGSN